MTLTLWRGESILGELRTRALAEEARDERPGRPTSLSMLLIPAAAAPPFSGVWQLSPPIPGIGVQQHPREPDIVAERGRHIPSSGQSIGSAALEPMTPEQERGVPRDQQLTVHDANGRSYLPLQVLLEESRYSPEHYEQVLREIPTECLINGSVWSVFLVFAPGVEVPAT